MHASECLLPVYEICFCLEKAYCSCNFLSREGPRGDRKYQYSRYSEEQKENQTNQQKAESITGSVGNRPKIFCINQ